MESANLFYRAAAWIVPLVIAIVFHEVAHGWAAKWLGDPTAAERRRLSFNPLRHVDPVGTVVLPMGLALAGAPVFGWAKPVPVDATRLRNPRTGMMLVALAGPAMNLVLALIAAIALGLVGGTLRHDQIDAARFVADNLINFMMINVLLALFNLLPLPPLDGGHVVQGLLPRPLAARFAGLARYGFLVLIGLLVVLPMIAPHANLIERLVWPPARAVMVALLSLAQAVA